MLDIRSSSGTNVRNTCTSGYPQELSSTYTGDQKGVYIPKSKEDQRKLIYTYAMQLKDQTNEINHLKNQNQTLQTQYCTQKTLSDTLLQKLSFQNDQINTIPTLKKALEEQAETIKKLQDQINNFQIRNDDQELRIVGLIKSEQRLLGLLKSTKKYNDLVLMPFSKTAKSKKSKKKANKLERKIKELKDANLVYLEGSQALSEFDTYTPKFSQQFKRKVPLHFRQWYAKAREGLLEDEKDLWTTHESIQIVRNFMSGAYSKREDLAIEKLIYELGKQQRGILKGQFNRKFKNQSVKIRRLKMSLKESQETIDALVEYIRNREIELEGVSTFESNIKKDKQFDIYPEDDSESKEQAAEDYIRNGGSSSKKISAEENEPETQNQVLSDVNEDVEYAVGE